MAEKDEEGCDRRWKERRKRERNGISLFSSPFPSFGQARVTSKHCDIRLTSRRPYTILGLS